MQVYSGSQKLCKECTPPITKSTITCTTSSTNQSSDNTKCSVPAKEAVNVTVTITNAAGVTASNSAYLGLLAKLQKYHLFFFNTSPQSDVLAKPCQGTYVSG